MSGLTTGYAIRTNFPVWRLRGRVRLCAGNNVKRLLRAQADPGQISSINSAVELIRLVVMKHNLFEQAFVSTTEEESGGAAK